MFTQTLNPSTCILGESKATLSADPFLQMRRAASLPSWASRGRINPLGLGPAGGGGGRAAKRLHHTGLETEQRETHKGARGVVLPGRAASGQFYATAPPPNLARTSKIRLAAATRFSRGGVSNALTRKRKWTVPECQRPGLGSWTRRGFFLEGVHLSGCRALHALTGVLGEMSTMFADTLLIVFISVCTALLAEGE